MAIEIKTNEVNGVIVVDLTGNLDSNTAPSAENEINQWLEKGFSKMVINLKDTRYVSSAGMRVFLSTAKKTSAAGGAMKLCSPNDVVKEVLEISGFAMILDVEDNLEKALKGF
jgi:anti-sigma B factor antagonist